MAERNALRRFGNRSVRAFAFSAFGLKLTNQMAITNQRADVRWLTSTVFGIGMASLFSDLSHEAVTAVLPALLASMGVAAGALGTIEGVADGLRQALA